MKRVAIAALVLLAAALVAGVARPEGSHAADPTTEQAHTLTVSGSGTATATPTRASVSFGVQTQAPTAKAALSENATAMRAVLDALARANAQDVQTETVSLSATYGDSGELRGYTAVNTVSATVTYQNAGATIDAAVDAGANEVDGPSPLPSDADALYRKALADALQNARGHADTLARASGATLGGVVSIVEGSSPGPIVYGKTAQAADASTPVVPGSQETDATVTVTYALSP